MKIKTFYAKSMAEAMQEIKATLGVDALLLSTREIPSRSGVGGATSGYEVVAASDDSAGASSPTSPALHGSSSDDFESHSAQTDRTPGFDGSAALTYSPSSLRKATGIKSSPAAERKAPAVRGSARAAQTPAISPDNGLPFADSVSLGVYSSLLTKGVDEWLARKLLIEGRELVAPRQRRARTTLLNAINHVAQSLIVSPLTTEGIPSRRVVVFLGPTGVGKTTSIAKLAARLALHHKKKIVLMTLDRYRIGAIEQLKTYAGLMGVPFRFVGEVSDLPRAIKENGQRDFILIDTTGRSPRDLASMQDLVDYLHDSDQVERHLVLSATTKASDLHEIVDRFEVCRPDHLLFTKLDETSAPGSVLNELVRTRKTMSYYSDGQRVPEDLHAAPKEQIVDLVLNRN